MLFFWLPECQFYICSDFLALQIQQLQLPIFEFPQSNYFPAILPTQSTISVQLQIFKLQQLSLPHAIQQANIRSCNDFNNCHWSLIYQPAYSMSYKLGIHISCSILESATTISHELFNFASCHWTATTSKHNSCCHDFYNYDWLLIFQLTYTTGIENSKCNEIHIMHRLHLPQLVLQFPLPLCSIFDTAIDNKIHNCFYNSCCISHCHWVTTTAISWQLHTSLHNSPEYFPPPSTTESTSCSIVPSPTSKHNEIHVWAFTIASTHHFASAMQSAHLKDIPWFLQRHTDQLLQFMSPWFLHQLLSQQVVHLANTTNSTFFSLLDFRKIHHLTTRLATFTFFSS